MKKELLVIIGSLEIGGTEKHLAMLLPELVSRGWSVRVIVLGKRGGLASYLEEKNVLVISLFTEQQLNRFRQLPSLVGKIARIGYSIIQLVRRLRQEKEAIIHFFLPEAYVVGMIAVLFAGFKGPTLMSRRSLNYYHQRRKGVALCERFLHKKTSLILGNSAAVIAQLREEKVKEEQLKLIYNGINMEPFSSTKSRYITRETLKIPNDALCFIIIANLIPYKGHADLLKAFSLIKNKLTKNWYLICVGRDDGIMSSLKQKAIHLGLSKHILWLGSRSDIPDLLSSADVGILCSHEEGFSNAILEGMAAGLPMVVTDVGGNKEAIIDGETGYVVPAKDPHALGLAILKMANHLDKTKEFGRLAKVRVKEHFSLETCVNAYIKLYEACQAEKGAQVSSPCVV